MQIASPMFVDKEERAKRLNEMAEAIRACLKCPLHASRTIAVPGDGKVGAKVMIVGEAPGREEDETGHPFVGAAGRFLDSVLEGSGMARMAGWIVYSAAVPKAWPICAW